MNRLISIIKTLVIANIIVWSFLFIVEMQNKRLNNTYTTLIRDGEVIRMTQKELIDYYKSK